MVILKLPIWFEDEIFKIAEKYSTEGVPLVVIAGKEYGTGSSRDWAAKGTKLLGIRVVIAESFERIHRSNLVGMGVLPLEMENVTLLSLGLNGSETFDIGNIDKISSKPNARLKIKLITKFSKVLVSSQELILRKRLIILKITVFYHMYLI